MTTNKNTARIKKNSSRITKIGIIGGGNMAEALIRGFKNSASLKRTSITVSDIILSRLNFLKTNYGVSITSNNVELVRSNEIIILAVKPQVISTVLSEIQEVASGKLIISIAAGVSVQTLKKALGAGRGPRRPENPRA